MVQVNLVRRNLLQYIAIITRTKGHKIAITKYSVKYEND